jgi:hypothetical protein
MLRAHHLDAWYVAPEKRYLVENGVLLHESVHIAFHQEYGDEVTAPHFEQFCWERYGVTFYPWKERKEEMQQTMKHLQTLHEKKEKDF